MLRILWVPAFFFLLMSHTGFGSALADRPQTSRQTLVELKTHHDVMRRLQAQGKADVLLHFDGSPDLRVALTIKDRAARVRYVYEKLSEKSRLSQAEARVFLQKRKASFQTFYIENVIAVDGATMGLLETMVQIPGVTSVSLNASAPLRLPPADRLTPSAAMTEGDIPGHLKRIGVDRVWGELGVRGRGIVIAGQDSGYYWEHHAIKRQYRGFNNGEVSHQYNWHDAIRKPKSWWSQMASCSHQSETPCDDNGHGTHTMGTMVGDDGGKNRIGVAPEAQWIGCRNMRKGVGTVSSYLECFEFFLAPYPKGGNPQTDGRPELAPHIINNSWGCPQSEGCSGNEFLDAVRAMQAAGIMVVAAAGNDGDACRTVADPPGHFAGELISVGAYNTFIKDIAYFSSRGPSGWNGGLAPFIVAPGTNIRSANADGKNSYQANSGTSMASPHIAGVIALLWSAHPHLVGQIKETADILARTAQPLRTDQTCGDVPGHQVPNAVFGYGMVDAYQAIKSVTGGG